MALSSLGKLLYGAVFVMLLPVALAAWARATTNIVRVPGVTSMPLGLAVASAGTLLLILGMIHLWVYGGGLPMNAYPPPRYVAKGIFRLLPHPIYTGFSMLCAGVSITIGSASGLWLVSPMVALGCVALVLGYERHDLRDRFGSLPKSLLPKAGLSAPSSSDRLACYLFVLLPWIVLYEGVVAMGVPPDAVSSVSPFEQRLPVLEWSEVFYASVYVLTALAPFFARTRSDLRMFAVRGLGAMAVAFPIFLAVPLIAPPRPFVPHTIFGHLLLWERTLDSPAAAFPSFHVIWAVLSTEVFSRRWPTVRWVWRCWALLIAVSCLTTGQHGLADVLAGFATFALVARGPALWDKVLGQAQCIANSWREWRIGPVRFINRGVYVGAGAFLALLIAETVAGPGRQLPILVAACAAVVGAAIWAQFIEGSSQLLRPFGFYGGLLGGALGALIAPLFGTSPWLVLAAFSLAGPWAQAMGRLGCLVQGCCHGRPAPESIGIRYVHPRSRVCRLTLWTGVPLHATPVYSILWNALIALTIARLWVLAAPLHLISGIYFIQNGLGRFVEEAWRGEPQTPVFLGLRLYQWAAIVSVLGGALMTALGASAPAPGPNFVRSTLLPAAVFGLGVAIAMGVDFPDSNRRFSRLV